VNAAADGLPHRPEVDGGHGGHHHRGRVMRVPSFVGLENFGDPQRGMRGARRLLQPRGAGLGLGGDDRTVWLVSCPLKNGITDRGMYLLWAMYFAYRSCYRQKIGPYSQWPGRLFEGSQSSQFGRGDRGLACGGRWPPTAPRG